MWRLIGWTVVVLVAAPLGAWPEEKPQAEPARPQAAPKDASGKPLTSQLLTEGDRKLFMDALMNPERVQSGSPACQCRDRSRILLTRRRLPVNGTVVMMAKRNVALNW